MTEDMAKAIKDNRVRHCFLEERFLLEVFRWFSWREQDPGSWAIALPIFKDIPDDAEVLSVFHESMARGFTFIIAHPSFDPVEIGEYPPRHTPELLTTPVIMPGYAIDNRIRDAISRTNSQRTASVPAAGIAAEPPKKIPFEFLGPPRRG